MIHQPFKKNNSKILIKPQTFYKKHKIKLKILEKVLNIKSQAYIQKVIVRRKSNMLKVCRKKILF